MAYSVVTNYKTTLSSPMTSSQLTVPVNSIATRDNTSHTLETADMGNGWYLTVAPGTSSEEIILVTAVATSGDGGVFTVHASGRGLAYYGTSDSVGSGNAKAHNSGEIVILSNVKNVYDRMVDKETAETIAGVKTFSVSPLVPTPTSSETTAAASVAYANALAIAGAPDASTTVKGIVEEATQAEIAAATAAGATAARLFTNPSTLAPHVQSGAWLTAVEDGTGSDDTYTAALTPTLTAYTNLMQVAIKFTVANTTACTLNLNGVGAKDIKKYVAGAIAALETGDIVAGQLCYFVYDSTNNAFIMVNPSATAMTTALTTEASTFFTNTDITGAEAETLTAGVASSANSLHTHTNIPTGHTLIVTYPGPDVGNPAVGCGYSYEAGVERITIGNDDGIRTVFRVATEAGLSLYPDTGPGLVAAIASCANILYADGHTWCAAAAGGTTANQDGVGVTFASQACSGAMTWDDGNSYLLFHNTTTNVRRFTYAVTTLTFVDNITLASACDTNLGWVFDDVNNMLYFIDTTDGFIRKFNTSGALQSSTAYTSINPSSSTIIGIVAISGRIYVAIRAGHGESSATASLDISVCSAMLVPTSVTF